MTAGTGCTPAAGLLAPLTMAWAGVEFLDLLLIFQSKSNTNFSAHGGLDHEPSVPR